MSIKGRYLELIEFFSAGVKRKFASRIKSHPSIIENICGSRESNPSFAVLEKTLNAFENINARWLITGKGNMLDSIATESQSKYISEKDNLLNKIVELASENAILKKENEELKKG